MHLISNFSNFEFIVDSESDPYGTDYWISFTKGEYEPDTTLTLLNLLSQNSIFFDIGAATGTMTLMAASQGSKVISYEPVGKFYDALRNNLKQNPRFVELVTLKKAIISTNSGQSTLSEAVGKSISTIVFNSENTQEEIVEEVQLFDEIHKHFIQGFKLVLKIDIEGAEYKILKDKNLLELLSKTNADVVLALHPGFFRPLGKRNGKLWHVKHLMFVARNFVDNVFLFKLISPYARIARSNKALVSSATKFALMTAAGVLEYHLNFYENN